MKNNDLLYYNEFGGFSKDYKEYIIKTKEKYTPVPWSHIMANEKFGTIVTSSGGGYTWHGNSRENKITSWSNLQIEDISSEEIFIKSENISVRAVPKDNLNEYEIHYGFGYAEFIREDTDICMKNLIYVPIDRNEKNSLLEIKNLDEKDKYYEIEYIINPVMGVAKEFTKKHLKFTKTLTGIKVQNSFREIYKNDEAHFEIIVDDIKVESEVTLDKKIKLKAKIKIEAKKTKKIICRIALEETTQKYENVIHKSKEDILKVQDYWDEKLEKIIIKTPVESFNIMMNGWLRISNISMQNVGENIVLSGRWSIWL